MNFSVDCRPAVWVVSRTAENRESARTQLRGSPVRVDPGAGRAQTSNEIWEDLDLGLALSESGLPNVIRSELRADASCRQLRHSPWKNQSYFSGGVRTARGRKNAEAVKVMMIELPFRYNSFTVMWLLFRP